MKQKIRLVLSWHQGGAMMMESKICTAEPVLALSPFLMLGQRVPRAPQQLHRRNLLGAKVRACQPCKPCKYMQVTIEQ